MSRSQGRVDSDQSYKDGLVPLGPADFLVQSGTSTFSRIAAGEYSLHFAASSGAFVVVASLTGTMYRTGVQDDLQEQYGSLRAGGAQGLPYGATITMTTASITAGTNVNVAVQNSTNFAVGRYVILDTVASTVQEYCVISAVPDATHITLASVANAHSASAPVSQNVWTTPAGITGRPPFTGVTQLTPPASRPKGISLKGVILAYLVTGANFTVPTVGVYSTQYQNNIAPVVTTLVTLGTNGLQTAAQTNPYVTYVPFAPSGFINTMNTVVSAEINGNVGATTTFDLLEVGYIVDYNYN